MLTLEFIRFVLILWHLFEWQEWPFEASRPTVLWFWRDVEAVAGRIDGRYKRYTNELDCVTQPRYLSSISNSLAETASRAIPVALTL